MLLLGDWESVSPGYRSLGLDGVIIEIKLPFGLRGSWTGESLSVMTASGVEDLGVVTGDRETL